MNQDDFFCQQKQAAPFMDIRNTRPTVAEEKAALAFELGRLCMKPPKSVVNGSIQATRAWVDAQKKALKLVRSPRASVQELTSAIGSMRGFLSGDK